VFILRVNTIERESGCVFIPLELIKLKEREWTCVYTVRANTIERERV